MTDQEQNVAVAEACGWRRDRRNVGRYGTQEDGWWMPNGKFASRPSDIPDYGSDLNACHEMERALTGPQYEEWCGCLSEAFCANKDRDHGLGIYSASAPQRREAFLRVLNLYTD